MPLKCGYCFRDHRFLYSYEVSFLNYIIMREEKNVQRKCVLTSTEVDYLPLTGPPGVVYSTYTTVTKNNIY